MERLLKHLHAGTVFTWVFGGTRGKLRYKIQDIQLDHNTKTIYLVYVSQDRQKQRAYKKKFAWDQKVITE